MNGEASRAGHCDPKGIAEGKGDLPGRGTPTQWVPARPRVGLQGVKMGIPSPKLLGATTG